MTEPNRNANKDYFAFEFQTIVGIVIALNNVSNLKSVNIEGQNQDVEIVLNDDSEILVQAKSYTKTDALTSSNTQWNQKLGSAFNSLLENYLSSVRLGLDNQKYIFAVNYPYPLGKTKAKSENFGDYVRGARKLTELNATQQKTIINSLLNFKVSDGTGGKTTNNNSWIKSGEDCDSRMSMFSELSDRAFIQVIHFLNFEERSSKFEYVDKLIEQFLNTNVSAANISSVSLREALFSLATSNGAYTFSLSRLELLSTIFGIFVAQSGLEYMHQEGIPRSQFKRMQKQFEKYSLNIIENPDFDHDMYSDISKYINGDASTDFNYSSTMLDDFLAEYQSKYFEQYFKNIPNISNGEATSLCKYTIGKYMEYLDETDFFLEKELKDVY